jgi:hypothetical protein
VTTWLGGSAEESFGDQVVIKEMMEKVFCTHFVQKRDYIFSLSLFLDNMKIEKKLSDR